VPACCRVQPRDMFSHACACWIMVGAPCTHLLGSCDTDRKAKEICRRAESVRTALIASDALAIGFKYAHLNTFGVYFFLARSLSLSFSPSLPLFLPLCAPWWVSALSTDARAHCANSEQCACSRGSVYTLAYVKCLVATCAHVVSCILYRSSGKSLRCISARSCASAFPIN